MSVTKFFRNVGWNQPWLLTNWRLTNTGSSYMQILSTYLKVNRLVSNPISIYVKSVHVFLRRLSDGQMSLNLDSERTPYCLYLTIIYLISIQSCIFFDGSIFVSPHRSILTADIDRWKSIKSVGIEAMNRPYWQFSLSRVKLTGFVKVMPRSYFLFG